LQGILDLIPIPLPRDFRFRFARDFPWDRKSLAKGFFIFNFQGYEYKVDDLIPLPRDFRFRFARDFLCDQNPLPSDF
jgi:hypothetical protein